jgi:hypothetical protein
MVRLLQVIRLDAQLGAAPVATLGVVADLKKKGEKEKPGQQRHSSEMLSSEYCEQGVSDMYLVVSAHAEPVGQRAVLLLLLSELTLDDERLVGRLQ